MLQHNLGNAAAGAVMMLLGQSRREAQTTIGPIVALKKQTTVSCWNVRTNTEATRTAQVAKEMNGKRETNNHLKTVEKERNKGVIFLSRDVCQKPICNLFTFLWILS